MDGYMRFLGEECRPKGLPDKWRVLVRAEDGAILAEARVEDSATGEPLLKELCDASDGTSAELIAPLSYQPWLRRRLPIYGQTVGDAEIVAAMNSTEFGSWLFRGARTAVRRQDLFWFLDIWANPLAMTVVDADRCFEEAEDDEDLEEDAERLTLEYSELRKTWLLLALRSKFGAVGDWALEHECAVDIEPLDPPETPGVYVIEGVGGWVKIGKAKNIKSRMRDIQLAHPVPLKLLAILDSDPTRESEFHRRYADLRAEREWFRFEGELRDAVRAARESS
jgi:hypothetical protein